MDSLKHTQKIVKISKVLSDPNRLEIIKLLSERPMCVHAIVHHLNISQPAVSKHLKLLTDTGLLVSEKKGMYVHYSLKKEILLNHLKDISKIVQES
jgi:ArsR family transcriptional regulator, arsenate/arsenite/antimonite-responsive transcriptional repressor